MRPQFIRQFKYDFVFDSISFGYILITNFCALIIIYS